MSISAIRLRHFRGFADATLPIKPLTVLLGPNSSGKSSFGHALAAMALCQRRDVAGRASLTPHGDTEIWPVDLGTLKDLRSSLSSERVYVGFEARHQWIHFGFGDPTSIDSDLLLTHISHPDSYYASHQSLDQIPVILNLEGPKSEVLRMNEAPSASSNLELSRQDHTTWWDAKHKTLLGIDLDGFIIRSLQPPGATALPASPEIRQELGHLLRTLTYLRAIRKRPLRSYEDGIGQFQTIGYEGEWTPTLLLERRTEPVKYFVPPLIPSSRLDAESSIDVEWEECNQPLVEAVSFWLRYLGLANAIEISRPGGDKRRVEVRIQTTGTAFHNITEVGFGISQVLPILTAGLLQAADSLLIVDLPEAHLHPLPQARLADFFISMIMAGQNVLIETHSEVFFHWLRLRSELNDSVAARSAIYFLDRAEGGCCSKPAPVAVTGDAQLRWPSGFFEEAWDIEMAIRFVRDARRSRS